MPGSLVFFALLFGAMYVLMVRPQQQRARRQRELISSIAVGDQVITAGGMIGEVVHAQDDRVTIRLAPGVEVAFLRGAIAQKLVDTDEIVDLDAADAGGFNATHEDLPPHDDPDDHHDDHDDHPDDHHDEPPATPGPGGFTP